MYVCVLVCVCVFCLNLLTISVDSSFIQMVHDMIRCLLHRVNIGAKIAMDDPNTQNLYGKRVNCVKKQVHHEYNIGSKGFVGYWSGHCSL